MYDTALQVCLHIGEELDLVNPLVAIVIGGVADVGCPASNVVWSYLRGAPHHSLLLFIELGDLEWHLIVHLHIFDLLILIELGLLLG